MELSDIKTRIVSLLSNIKPRYIIILIGLIIAVEAVWAYQTIVKTNQALLSQSSSKPEQPKSLNVISLNIPKQQFKIGEIIPVDINIESNKLNIGADLIIHYDPNLLVLVPNPLKAPITVGVVYDEFPLNQADEKTGVIAVSGITNNIQGVMPKGLFGTILFQARAAGNAKIFLEFTKGKTNDTNLIEGKTSTDILEEVKNVDINIIP